ncbi:MAG: polyketide cyclase [Gammaproteobacteria bacterium]|jgi:hypothetical protein|nr:polyketide cyclase [Gammaproteobacteria bacterium]
MAIKIERIMPYSPATIWAIVGQPGRVDWVPGVESAEFDGEVRRFKMLGAGGLAERITQRDESKMYLEYSVIESTPPLQSHLASITLEAHDEGTRFIWQTAVEPVEVEPFIAKGMKGSLELLTTIIAAQSDG